MLAESLLQAEYASICQAFEKCLNLRDKYMSRSLQRLGDNPRDWDGQFDGLDDDHADVPGTRPDSDIRSNRPSETTYPKWTIYPKPPPPHWHWSARKEDRIESTGTYASSDEDFDFNYLEIPGAHNWQYAIDDRGVYQVYEEDATGKNQRVFLGRQLKHVVVIDRKPKFDIPSLKEYFIDLDFVLGVISGGPMKSFAFKRLKFLSSKFTMYTLLNDVVEVAETKVRALQIG